MMWYAHQRTAATCSAPIMPGWNRASISKLSFVSKLFFLGGLPSNFCPVTRAAVAPPFFGKVSVVWRKLMAVRTVGLQFPVWPKLGVRKRKAFTRHNFIITHPARCSFYKGVVLDANFINYLNGSIRLPFNFNKNSVTPVSLLLFFSGPLAIVRRIAFVVIYPFKRMFRARLIAYVRDKLVKIAPFFAYCNAASSIIFPLLISWVCAPLPHRGPNTIKRMWVFKRHQNSLLCFTNSLIAQSDAMYKRDYCHA